MTDRALISPVLRAANADADADADADAEYRPRLLVDVVYFSPFRVPRSRTDIAIVAFWKNVEPLTVSYVRCRTDGYGIFCFYRQPMQPIAIRRVNG